MILLANKVLTIVKLFFFWLQGFLNKLANALQLTSAPELIELNNAIMPSLLCAAAANEDEGKTLSTLLSSSEGKRSISCADYDRRTPLHVACSAGNEGRLDK